MHSRAILTSAGALAVAMAPFSLSAEDDPLAPYKVTQTTQTETYDDNGHVTGKEVIKDSKVDIKERIVEKYVRNGDGIRLVGRTTTFQDTTGKVVTTVEASLRPDADDPVVINVTTFTKDASGNSMTTIETRNVRGELDITRRVTVTKDKDGNRTVTTVETLDKYGRLVITSQTVAK